MTTEDEEFKANTLKSRTFWCATQQRNARSVCLKHGYEIVREDADVYVDAWTQSMLDQVQYMGAAADR